MKPNLLPWQLLTLVALVVPSLYLFYAWPALPAQIPTHFGLNGQANDYTSRGHIWLLTLALPLGIFLLFSILPRFDPKRRLDSSSVNFQKLRLAVVALLSALACYVLYVALHPGTQPTRGMMVLLGLFFAFMGNYLTTVQPNYFIGIRTPWTLENATVWARTHRLGGILFCLSGLLLLVLALVLPLRWLPGVLFALVMGPALVSYGYSYWVFRQQERLHGAT
jgi:uncharacterized membrane protein